jgi:predicted RNA-binding Zn ribbon-like protein
MGGASGSLELVAAFVNTLELEGEGTRELIGTPAALGRWLEERGLLDECPISAAELATAVDLRAALRRLMLANNGGPLLEADLAVLNQVASDSGLRPRFHAGGVAVLEPAAGGVRGALGRLLAAVAVAMSDGTWGRLKACADPTCQWAFYDTSKNWSRHWCSMEVCGNRAKARQFRRRRRPTPGPAAGAG